MRERERERERGADRWLATGGVIMNQEFEHTHRERERERERDRQVERDRQLLCTRGWFESPRVGRGGGIIVFLLRILCSSSGNGRCEPRQLRGAQGSVRCCLLWLLYLHWSWSNWVQEVPDEDGVVVGAADDLKVVELQSKHPPRVLLSCVCVCVCVFVCVQEGRSTYEHYQVTNNKCIAMACGH